MEAMGGFFNDRANPNQAKKKPFLKEIFKVAKVEEQYKRGEIGWLQRSWPVKACWGSLLT